MGYVDPVLVCRDCAAICKSEEEFLQHYLKPLMNGAYFHLSDSSDPSAEYNCKLSPDHRQILISDDHASISMKNILEVKTLTGDEGGDSVEGGVSRKRSGSGPKGFSLELVYKSGVQEYTIVFTPVHSHSHQHSHSHSRKQAVEWLRGLKKALIMLHSNKR